MSAPDGTKTCDHDGCNCRVADTESHIRENGKIYCSEACSKGESCGHDGCDCGSTSE